MQQAPTADYAEHRERVRPEWADESGLLAPAYAVVIFDTALDVLYDGIGIGTPYRRATNCSTFTLETHLVQEQPVREGETVLIRNHILAADAKRMHIAQEMFRPGYAGRAALMEQLAIHVDLGIRRSAPFPPELLARIHAAMTRLAAAAPPAGTGQLVRLAA